MNQFKAGLDEVMLIKGTTNKDTTYILLLFLLIGGNIRFSVSGVSTCQKYFFLEPTKSKNNRWFGLITLENKTTRKGITVDLEFDKPVKKLGNFFAPVESNSENTKFQIINPNKLIPAGETIKIEIYGVYESSIDKVSPNLIKLTADDRELCPNEETVDTDEDYERPTILTQMKLSKCGTTIVTTTGLITHGQDTIKGQFPWHAAIFTKNGNRRNYSCGGSLISEEHILTAAHCILKGQALRTYQEFIVVLGKHGLWVDAREEQTFNLKKITVHKNFNRTNFYNDIAILYLDRPAQYTDYVRPICLWSRENTLNSIINKTGTVAGWGRDHEQNPSSDLLTMASLPVLDRLECSRIYPQFYSIFANENNFCAGYRNGTSVCNGDSGDGLIFPKPGSPDSNPEWEIRGLVSSSVPKFDRTCDTNYYPLFTDVANYLEWITDEMNL